MSLTGQVIIVEMILCLRLYGIYGNKKVLYFLGGFLGLCLVLCIVILAAIGGGHNAIDSIIATPIGRLPPCRSMASFDKFWLYCIPLLVFESTAFCMVLYKAYQRLRDQRRFGMKAQSNTSRLISVLYRDSILYFAGISLVLVTSCVLFSNSDPSYSVLVETLGTGLASIMGGRVLLDVRAASEINESATMGNITTVEFASNSTSSTEVNSDHLSYIGTSWSV
ncbi:hypothetical protein QCA50_008862 [Cerrena zonata]|uniref:Uncharacterized protein n=1 Tax=Cerrena zonata TaxID=2478898 RepID=A0AAW0G7Z2_9APHY